MAFTADKVRQGVQKDTGYDIPYSARFNDDDSAYLSRTPSTAGNRKTWTWSGWVKRGNINTSFQILFGAEINPNTTMYIGLHSDNNLRFQDGSTTFFDTSALLRDTSAWYNIIVAFDTTQATASDRVKVYINGVEITSFSSSTNPSLNTDYTINNSVAHTVGRWTPTDLFQFDGYLAEVHFIDGQALTPSDFGETGDYGEWKAKKYTGTYSGNSFYLPFDNAGTKHTLTASGNAQHSTSQNKIGSSSMVFDGAGDYVSVSNPSDIKGLGDFTIECWVRPNATSFSGTRFIMGNGGGQDIAATIGFMQKGSDGKVYFHGYIGSTAYHPAYSNTVGVSVSTTAWTHVSAVRSGGTITVYKDGVSQGTISNSSAVSTPSSNAYSIGRLGSFNGGYYDGYLDEIRISNNARYTSGFTPSTTAFTDDDNTLLLVHSDTSNGSTTFTDSSGVTGALGNDQSGEANHWTPNNLAATDQMLDSPTNNFCTMNPLAGVSGNTFTEGNTQVLCSSSGSLGTTLSTMNFTSGKWYAEFYLKVMDTRGQQLGITGDSQDHSNGSNWISQYSDSYIFYGDGTASRKYNNNSQTSYGANWAAGDIIGVAVDLDSATSTITFYHNGSSQGTAYSSLSGTSWVFAYGDASTNINLSEFVVNFGQDSSFAGNDTTTAGPYTDSGSVGDFFYEPPTDFLALCTSNLPDPAVIPSEHFNTVLWTGTGSSNARTDVGFQPDFTWIKGRSHISNHRLMNSIAGATKYLLSNAPQAEGTDSQVMSSFDSNGFTVGTEDDTNGSSKTFVAWNWKAGGTGVSNTNGSITSTVSANADAGFSIVSWTGDGSDATIGHSLNSVPKMIIHKHRSGSVQWNVYHESAGTGGYLRIDGTHAWNSNSGFFGTAPTSSVFSPGSHSYMSGSGHNNIAYCFADVDGYSKVGSYTGNGSTDGTFVYTGFRPAYVMIKDSGNAEQWWIFDSTRDVDNVAHHRLGADGSGTEGTNIAGAADNIDFVSNGIKIRSNGGSVGGNTGSTYIFIAFAESPFKHTNAR